MNGSKTSFNVWNCTIIHQHTKAVSRRILSKLSVQKKKTNFGEFFKNVVIYSFILWLIKFDDRSTLEFWKIRFYSWHISTLLLYIMEYCAYHNKNYWLEKYLLFQTLILHTELVDYTPYFFKLRRFYIHDIYKQVRVSHSIKLKLTQFLKLYKDFRKILHQVLIVMKNLLHSNRTFFYIPIILMIILDIFKKKIIGG